MGVVRAVASSCSVPGVYPPVTLKGRRYIDGGMRSPTNADMAAGHESWWWSVAARAQAAAALGERMAARFNEEIESLKGGGATVVVITPRRGQLRRVRPEPDGLPPPPDAARAGLAQGLAYAARAAALLELAFVFTKARIAAMTWSWSSSVR